MCKNCDYTEESFIKDSYEAIEAVQRVRELHSQCDCCGKTCVGCEDDYPCLTIEALEGETE